MNDLDPTIPEDAIHRSVQGWQEIIEASQVEVFIGGSQNQYIPYPNRLVSAGNARRPVVDAATNLIVDSHIGNEEITNETVVKAAIKYDADWVIPEDHVADPAKSHRKLREFLDIYDDRDCPARILVPIQPNHRRHYLRYEDFLSDFSHFAIGGMKDKSPQEQISAVTNFREVAGDEKFVHGLGMGASKRMITAMRENENFIDSVDNQIYETLPGMSGKILDANLNQQEIEFPKGDSHNNKLLGLPAAYQAYMVNYLLSPYYNPDKPDQETLSSYRESEAKPKTETQRATSDGQQKIDSYPA